MFRNGTLLVSIKIDFNRFQLSSGNCRIMFIFGHVPDRYQVSPGINTVRKACFQICLKCFHRQNYSETKWKHCPRAVSEHARPTGQ